MGGKDQDMVDVDAQHATEPSLQRLKTLDSLPDLKSQLKIANEFCNHGHRAEMIIRWLTGKLQNDSKAVVNAEAWSLLEHCFRLVAPQKMGLLLARFDLFTTIKKSILDAQEKKVLKLLETITKLVETLEEIAFGSDGAAVKQLLSVDGVSAAALLGAWIGRVSGLLNDKNTQQEGSSDIVRLASTALRLWTGRKPNATDNDTFAQNCLAPCSILLKQLSSVTSSSSNKRRRGAQSGTSPDADVCHDLEILVARHIFLPSRSALLQTTDKPEAESESTPPELAMKLASIKSNIAASGECEEQLCGALPNLLDVALRCVPMTTSKQRSKERPWVECAFQELLACLDVDGKLVSQSALSGMLHVVGKRASLPASTLKDLVQRYSGLGSETTSGLVDFTLIAEVVALDATVFVDAVMADELFPSLTAASIAVKDSAEKVAEASSLLVDSIARPIMRAFAGSRKLEDFIWRWHHQLLSVDDSKIWTIWTELDDDLADLLEVHLTAEQIAQLFDSLNGAIAKRASEKKKSSKSSSSKEESTIQAQQAGVVLFHALLKGVRSDELIAKLQNRMEDLFSALLTLVDTSKITTISTQTWRSLALAFKLWFPSWAVQQMDESLVEKKAHDLLSNSAVESIMKAKVLGKDVGLGETFVGLLCSYLQDYRDCRDLATSLVQRLSKPNTAGFSTVFLVFPDLLSLLDKDDRQSTIENIAAPAISIRSEKVDLASVRQALAAFMSIAATSPNTKIADEVFAAILNSTESDEEKSQIEREHAVLDLLLRVPATALARGQRERILNWASGLEYSSDVDEVRITKRYAVMIRLMHLPNATANLCTDVSTLWGLCRTAKKSRKSKSGKEKKLSVEQTTPALDALSMLEELARLLCAYLLSTQDQERSRAVLQALIKQATEEAKSLAHLHGASCERLVIVKTIVEQTDSGTNKGVLTHLAGDATGSLVQFGARVLEETQTSVKALKKRNDTEQAEVVAKVLLETLLCLRKSSLAGDVLAKEDKALTKLCNKILAKSSDDGVDIVEAARGTNKLLVPAFSLLAHIRGFEACTSLGEALLASSISPKDKQLLLEELRHLAKNSKVSDQLASLKQVMPKAQNASAQSIAILQNALAVVSKDSIAKDESGVHALYVQLLEILHQTKDFATYTATVSCLLTIIRDKPFILNQHRTEATLQAIQSLARSSPAERLIYLDLCSILSALLLHHRARLQGRFHLLTATLQALQNRLFVPTKPTADSERRTLGPRHARAYTRLLTLLCNPPTRTHHSNAGKHNSLVDESRRARAHVGQFVPTLLHGFCAQILSGTLGEGVREALTPGLWAVIEAMEVQSPDAIKALSAGMNNSERAVLRSVYDDWKRFGKWEGA